MASYNLFFKTKSRKGEAAYFIEILLGMNPENECIIWPFSKNRQGYAIFWKDGKTSSVCRYICEKLYGPRDKNIHAAHECGKGSLGCCNPSHLKWKTPHENAMDKEIHGTVMRGERHGSSKLTEKDILDIRSSKKTPREIAREYPVSKNQILNIISGRSWAHIK